jgi:hypothetical protein
VEGFGSLAEAKVLGKAWRETYNHQRTHSALGTHLQTSVLVAYSKPLTRISHDESVHANHLTQKLLHEIQLGLAGFNVLPSAFVLR